MATAALSATDIAAPIRKVLSHCENCTVLLGHADAIDTKEKRVHTIGAGGAGPGNEGDAIAYDYLVLAAGVTNRYFGHDDWQAHAPGLKSLEEALASAGACSSRTSAPKRTSRSAERASRSWSWVAERRVSSSRARSPRSRARR